MYVFKHKYIYAAAIPFHVMLNIRHIDFGMFSTCRISYLMPDGNFFYRNSTYGHFNHYINKTNSVFLFIVDFLLFPNWYLFLEYHKRELTPNITSFWRIPLHVSKFSETIGKTTS